MESFIAVSTILFVWQNYAPNKTQFTRIGLKQGTKSIRLSVPRLSCLLHYKPWMMPVAPILRIVKTE